MFVVYSKFMIYSERTSYVIEKLSYYPIVSKSEQKKTVEFQSVSGKIQ